MKTLEQLGISPAPWIVTPNNLGSEDVTANDSTVVVAYEPPFEESKDIINKTLIAAAPELYEALRLWVEELCEDCQAEIGKTCDGKCEAVRRAVAALEKAGGEE